MFDLLFFSIIISSLQVFHTTPGGLSLESE